VAQPALVFLVLVIATLATAFLVTIPVSKAAVTASKPSNGSSKKQTTKASVTEGPREEGEVKWFNVSKGFGFITKDDGEEIFVHFRSIIGEGRRGLKDGQRVSFVEANTDKGPQAEDVEPL
jgi:CspA family cold shock protein